MAVQWSKDSLLKNGTRERKKNDTRTTGHSLLKLLELNNKITRDFPGGPVVKNPSCNARDAGSIPDQGTKIPHAAGQLSQRATTIEPECRNYRAHALWSPRTTMKDPVCHN